MFTGIVTAVGRISELNRREQGLQLFVEPSAGCIELETCSYGDSISVAGVCLTMLDPGMEGFRADVSPETLAITTLAGKAVGDMVNLELAMRASDRLGGHMVSGHVDATTRLLSRKQDGDAERFEFELSPDQSRYVSRKGSVCLDGVSLTVNAVSADRFSTCIIPHTLAVTTLGSLAEGDRVNLEVDLIARYLEKLAQERIL
jgi:riboflavin synthase